MRSIAVAALPPAGTKMRVTCTTNPCVTVAYWIVVFRPGVAMLGQPIIEQGCEPVLRKTIATVATPIPTSGGPSHGSVICKSFSTQADTAGDAVVSDGVTIGATAMGDGEAVTFEVRKTPQPARAINPPTQLKGRNARRASTVVDTGSAYHDSVTTRPVHALGTDSLAI
ncbi:MAG TPA: hypothetical protein VGD55_03560 [Acidothermaceae bacterium]